MASWSGWDTETDEKVSLSGFIVSSVSTYPCFQGADAHDNRPYSSLGFDARDVGFSVQNIPPSLPDTFSGQHRDLPPVARTDSASWYLCGKDEFFIPDHASLFGTLPPGYGSHSEVSKHIEAVSPNSSIGEEYQETVSASTSSRPQDGSHGIPLPKFKEAIDKMIKAQNDISTRRLRVQQMRQKLNYKREEEGALRAKVMKRLNVVSTQKGDITPPSSEFEQLQLATDAYLDLERNYNEAEDELEEQEYALFKTLSKLSDFLRQNSTKVTVGTPEVNDYNSDSTSSTTSEAQEIPPTVVQYLSRVGDMHMLRERLSELDSQWLSIADQQSVRQRVGVPMAEESLVFLRSYDGERAQVQSEMNDVLLDMNRLREICYNEGTPVDQYAKGIDFIPDAPLNEAAKLSTDPLRTLTTPLPFSSLECPPSLTERNLSITGSSISSATRQSKSNA